jgi:hypothetical protein
MSQRTFKYKLDFYYQQALLYLLVFLLYAGIKGSFFSNQFSFVFQDPIVYIMLFFVVIALITLVLNLARSRKLVITDDRMAFHSRTRQHEILFSDIEWMHIGRERMVQTAGHFQLIVFKMKGRKRLFRIRVGRYERDRELVAEMEHIAQHVPKGRHRRFGMRRRKAL